MIIGKLAQELLVENGILKTLLLRISNKCQHRESYNNLPQTHLAQLEPPCTCGQNKLPPDNSETNSRYRIIHVEIFYYASLKDTDLLKTTRENGDLDAPFCSKQTTKLRLQ